MIANRIRRALNSLLLCELCSVFLSFSICYFAFYARLSQSPGVLPYQPKNLVFFFIIIFVTSSLSACVHFYTELQNFISHASTSLRTYFRTSIITQLVIGGTGIVCAFFMFSARAGLIFLIYTLIICIIFSPTAYIISNFLKKFYNTPGHRLNILLVGINRRSVRFYMRMRENVGLGLHIAGFVDEESAPVLSEAEYLGKPEMVEEIIEKYGINIVLFFLPMRTYYDTCAKIVEIAESRGVTTHSAGNLFERPKQPPSAYGINALGNALLHGQKNGLVTGFLQRARDLTVAAMLLLLGWPLYLVLGIALAVANGLPLLNRRNVVGKNMKQFKLFSFNTVPAAKASGIDGPQAQPTGLAKLLQGLHLSAVPSILNLTLGDITLFGPKALSEEEFERLSPEEQMAYVAIKPGLFRNHN